MSWCIEEFELKCDFQLTFCDDFVKVGVLYAYLCLSSDGFHILLYVQFN